MDKNTLTGLLLMALVVFGFMWLNKPSEAEIAAQREKAEQQARQEAQATEQSPSLTLDSITPEEIKMIVATVRELGTADTASSTARLATGRVDLRVAADGAVSGTIMTADSAGISAADIIYNRIGSLSPVAARAALSALRTSLEDAARYRGFARCLHGDSTTVKLENEYLSLELSTKGGIITRASLKDYERYDSVPVQPFSPGVDAYSFTLASDDNHFDTSEFYFTPVQGNDSTVLMKLDLGDGATWGIRYTLPAGGYTVNMDIVQANMGQVIGANVSEMEFNWRDRMHRNEAGRMFEERNSALYYMTSDGDVDNLSESSTKSTDMDHITWIGYKNQFFSTVLIAPEGIASAKLSSTVLEDDPRYLKEFSTEAIVEYSTAKANPASFIFFIGPNSYPLLSDIQNDIVPEKELHLTNLIPLGWSLFRWINTLIVIPTFSFLGQYISNYGVIILLLTIFIKLILFPFTYKSYMSQAKMRVLAPEIKEINDKYPGNENAMKRQQETMALYSRAGASPFSGCLPLLLQMPILIAMFNFFPSAIELRGEAFLWVKDLSAPDSILTWSANIPVINWIFGNQISLFCLLMTVTNILYTYLNMQTQPSTSSNPMMKWMMYLMPLMFLYFFNNYAAGLSYYYFLSLLITIVQTYIFRRVVDEDKVRETMRANARKPKKKSGFMARLEEAQRRQQQLLKEQERQRGNRSDRRRN